MLNPVPLELDVLFELLEDEPFEVLSVVFPDLVFPRSFPLLVHFSAHVNLLHCLSFFCKADVLLEDPIKYLDVLRVLYILLEQLKEVLFVLLLQFALKIHDQEFVNLEKVGLHHFRIPIGIKIIFS